MKTLILLFCLFFSEIILHAQAFVYKKTKNFFVVGNIRNDYRVFGYSSPDATSKKLILFSIFTKEVEGNPYKCPLGSYYETAGMKEGDKIILISIAKTFIKLKYITAYNNATIFYIKRNLIRLV